MDTKEIHDMSYSDFMANYSNDDILEADMFYDLASKTREERKGTGILEQMRKNPIKYNASITLDRFRKFINSLH